MLFSALPTNLGNRENRFPHSHRHDYDEKHVRKSPQRSLLKLPASNPPFRLISGLEKTCLALDGAWYFPSAFCCRQRPHRLLLRHRGGETADGSDIFTGQAKITAGIVDLYMYSLLSG